MYLNIGHLCALDGGAIEANSLLFAYGYVKPVWSDSPGPEDGIATKEIGPINEWFFSGFDGGQKAIVCKLILLSCFYLFFKLIFNFYVVYLLGFGTSYADYYLLASSDLYSSLMNELEEKVYLSKAIIELLAEDDAAEYEDLLSKLQTIVMPSGARVTEDSLFRFAEFICDRVYHFDQAGAEDEPQLILSPCMRTLIKLSGTTVGRQRATRKAEKREPKVKKATWTKATTTPHVMHVFVSLFHDQLDHQGNNKFGAVSAPRRTKCGICEACQNQDCGKCRHCKDMVKFGGTGRSKQSCMLRKCPNMAVQMAEDDEENALEEEPDVIDIDVEHHKVKPVIKPDVIKWEGPKLKNVDGLTYYSVANVNGMRVEVGGHVTVQPAEDDSSMYLARVIALFQEDKTGEKKFHAV